jgi:ubiquinone/menaquinone biosynthesis C-methylase UbiE
MDKNIESVKQYWNSRPCNIRHSNKEVGTREYFDEVQTRKYLVEPHIPVFADFPYWKGKKVLEIGCGIGTDTVNFASNGAILTSVDLSEESLSLAKKRLEVYDLDADVKYANAENLSEFVEPQVFDLVYSFGVLHHTPNPEAAFQEVKKFMGPDSEFRMMVYNKGAFKVFQILEEYDFQYDVAEDLIAKHSEAQTGCPVTYSYTPSQITNILENEGFEVTSVEIDHIFPYKVDLYKKYVYEKEEIWNMPDETFRNFEKRYGWHLLVKAKLK